MTREEWKERLPLIQAFAEGKNVQINMGKRGWLAWHSISFLELVNNYRIVPESKLRPWTAEEVPVGALVRAKGGQVRAIITSFDPESMYPIQAHRWEGNRDWFSAHMEHSTDGGKTWLPCGVVEGEK